MRKRNTEPASVVRPQSEPANDQADDLYTISELATRWRVTRHVVTATIRAGRLQAFKVGERYYRIRKAEVIRYEQQQLAVAS